MSYYNFSDPALSTNAATAHDLTDDVLLSPPQRGHQPPNLTRSDAETDVAVLIWSMRLASTRRYFHQRFWEQETRDAEYASLAEPFPRLESVAEHSWHVADSVLLLGPRFPQLNVSYAVMLAILHDKMEIVTGDISPVGRDGTGQRTHAFDARARQRKDHSEREAADHYLGRLNPAAAQLQSTLLNDLLEGRSPEASFVKAVDKLQALAFVLAKKASTMTDKHLLFTVRYSEKVVEYWPELALHLDELRSRLIRGIADARGEKFNTIYSIAFPDQLRLF